MDPSMEEGETDRRVCRVVRSREIFISRFLSSHLGSIELLFLSDSLVLIARYLSYCETRTPHARSLPLLFFLFLLCLLLGSKFSAVIQRMHARAPRAHSP